MMTRQKTFEVEHAETHYPTNAQLRHALNAALKDDDVTIDGDVEYFLVENTSGGPSKVRATFTEGKKAPAKDDRTMTAGGKKQPVAKASE